MRLTALLGTAALVLACSGDTGPRGPAGPGGAAGDDGSDGSDGSGGNDGDDGSDGEDGRTPLVVGTGLEIEVMDADIDMDGVATVTYRITDGDGTPLDIDGLFTAGAVSPSFVLAVLGQNGAGEALQYTAFTTVIQTSPITGDSAVQAASDSGGTNEEVGIADGTYTYTFDASADGTDRALTHTVGIYATRDFEGERFVANALFDFVPDGSPVTVTRDVSTTGACNGCHNPISLHGNRRREMQLCILCHSPQSVDPDTGNTVDMKVMIHKLHMGHDLPSVEAGGTYEIIGFRQSVHNYDTVGFPREIRSCDTCHDGADGDVWMTRPSRETCRSCHDLTSFEDVVPEGEEAHAAGPMPDDTACSNIGCHRPTGGLAGIVDSHLFQLIDPATPAFSVTIDDVRNGGQGQLLDVDITVTVDGVGRDILTEPLNRIRFTVAGPTIDYKEYFQVTGQNNGAAADGTFTAIDAAAGEFTYSFPVGDEIPADAEGSYAVGIEARIPSATGNVNAFNPVAYFAVTDPEPVARRQVVDQAGCDSCHQSLAEHGGSRRSAEYCAMCHTPNNTNDERVSAVEGTTVFAESVDLRVMIHKLHRGEELVNDYVLGGFPLPTRANPAGNQIDFAEVRFPGDLRSCGTCHIAGTYDLPLSTDLLPTRFEVLTCTETTEITDPGDDPPGDDDLCEQRDSVESFLTRTTAVCTSCHDDDSSKAHAEIMTTMAGAESCTTCHGPGAAFDIAAVHRLDP